jgi:hypothetical protein
MNIVCEFGHLMKYHKKCIEVNTLCTVLQISMWRTTKCVWFKISHIFILCTLGPKCVKLLAVRTKFQFVAIHLQGFEASDQQYSLVGRTVILVQH